MKMVNANEPIATVSGTSIGLSEHEDQTKEAERDDVAGRDVRKKPVIQNERLQEHTQDLHGCKDHEHPSGHTGHRQNMTPVNSYSHLP